MHHQPPDPGPMTKKKRVSWAEEDSLCIIHYFEMDESERGNDSLTACTGRPGTVQETQPVCTERQCMPMGMHTLPPSIYWL